MRKDGRRLPTKNKGIMGFKCTVPNCGRIHKGHGFCEMHLDRVNKTGDPLKTINRPYGYGSYDKKGYRILFKNGKLIPEHRWVMEQHIGRKLKYPGEVVHHIDRNILNNDINNLKLMSNSEHTKLHFNEKHHL